MRPHVVLLVIVLVAGCFGGGRPTVRDGAAPGPLSLPELVVDHDHADPALHNESAGLRLVGFADAKELLGPEPARFSDIQFHGDLAAVTVNGRGGATSGGFVLLNIENPRNPVPLGRYRSGSEDNWYTKFTPDGRYVLLTANGNTNPQGIVSGAQENLRGSVATFGARGIQLVDVADPRNPSLEAYFPAPVRVINLVTWIGRDQATYVAASMVHDRVAANAGPVASNRANYVSILQLLPATNEAPAALREVSRWQPADAGDVANAFPHDLAFGVHPHNTKHLLFVAYWDAGAYIVDVTIPTQPATASRIRPLSAEDHVHTFKPHPNLINGDYYGVVAPETFAAEAIGTYRLVNITDARRPQVVRAWSPAPELQNPEALLFSPHEFHVMNDRVYASQFHGGAWILRLPELEPVATFQASYGDVARTRAWALDVASTTWYRDYVWAVNMGTGVLVLEETWQTATS